MARTAHQEYLAVLRTHETAQTALWQDLAARLETVLMRETGPAGKVPVTRGQAVRDEAETLVNNLFLGTVQGGLAPFEVIAGRVVPRSPYMAALWGGVVSITRVAVEQHAAILERQCADAPDVLAALKMARRNPFTVAGRLSEQTTFRPRPFVAYDPLHRWVRPDGYTLSTRIWRANVETRRKLDAFLAQGIAEGRGSLVLAREVERFLVPGRGLVKTSKPYGTSASFDAMRLARTEIASAHARAGYMAAQLNPFVTQYQPVLSHRHTVLDVCDTEVDGGPYEAADDSHLPVYHSQCMCRVKWLVGEDSAAILEDLRAQVFAGQRPGAEPLLINLIGPLLVDKLVDLLLGEPAQVLEEWV